MPGIAEIERRTKLKQEQKRRQKDMEELSLMIKENRLHEADERQLETLRMVKELQQAVLEKPTPVTPEISIDHSLIAETITQAVEKAITDKLTGQTAGTGTPAVIDSDRPSMGHLSIDLNQKGEEVTISHDSELGESSESEEDAAAKLKRLREIKGNK